jgi:hypothetical protein
LKSPRLLSGSLSSRSILSRHSFALVGFSLTHLVSAVMLAMLLAMGSPIPEGDRPSVFRSGEHSRGVLPPPDASTSVLLASLPSPMSYTRFLAQYGVRARATGPVDYLRNFRLSLDEFRSTHWTGDCNDFANTIAELGYRQGFPMGLISMWPSRWQDRLRKDWHQAAFLCLTRDREYLVFEFDEVVHWRGTLMEYANSQGKRLMPIGGVIDWRPTRPNPIARLMDHLRSNRVLPEYRPSREIRTGPPVT